MPLCLGLTTLSLSVDQDSYRTFTAKYKVAVTGPADGPAAALECPGVPQVGELFSFGSYFPDDWVFVLPTASVEPYGQRNDDEPILMWMVSVTLSNKPLKRCQDNRIENPLLEPTKINGGVSGINKEVTQDRNGYALITSAGDRLRGPEVEFDHNHSTISIEYNSPTLGLATNTAYVNTVNHSTIWGISSRQLKCRQFSWERKFYGTCTVYWTLKFEFEADTSTTEHGGGYIGWDREVIDKGPSCLIGEWNNTGTAAAPNWTWVDKSGGLTCGITTDGMGNEYVKPPPMNMVMQYKDPNGENSEAMLDGGAKPLTSMAALDHPTWLPIIRYYQESDFSGIIPGDVITLS
jgi:hypothetical protein